MIIHILNYRNEKIPVEVPDGTTTVSGKVVTGDMILTDPAYFDSDVNKTRLIDYFDGNFECSVEKLEECKTSYDVFFK